MLDVHAARDRAYRFAISTGHMPNMDLIHARQRAEGFQDCFGRCLSECTQRHCKWHRECKALQEFEPISLTQHSLRGLPVYVPGTTESSVMT